MVVRMQPPHFESLARNGGLGIMHEPPQSLHQG